MIIRHQNKVNLFEPAVVQVNVGIRLGGSHRGLWPWDGYNNIIKVCFYQIGNLVKR